MDYSQGIFIKELNNRFKAEILIDGRPNICYVGSSCKLDKLIDITNHEVILQKTSKINQNLKFSLVAAKFKNKYIILNSSFANIAYENLLKSTEKKYNSYKFIREYTISRYKSDFYITDTKTIIEVKSIITEKDEVLFPQIKSLRFKKQINTIPRLLDEGYNFKLIIISLNPELKKVILKKELVNLKDLSNNKFKIEAYTCALNYENKPKIKKKIKIEWED